MHVIHFVVHYGQAKFTTNILLICLHFPVADINAQWERCRWNVSDLYYERRGSHTWKCPEVLRNQKVCFTDFLQFSLQFTLEASDWFTWLGINWCVQCTVVCNFCNLQCKIKSCLAMLSSRSCLLISCAHFTCISWELNWLKFSELMGFLAVMLTRPQVTRPRPRPEHVRPRPRTLSCVQGQAKAKASPLQGQAKARPL